MGVNPKILIALAAGAVVTAGVTIGIVVPSAPSRTTSSPTGLTTDCSVDMTSALNTYFSTTIPQSNVNVTMPANACLRVSNSTSSLLTLNALKNVTINWNGDTLKQTTYDTSGTNLWQPVLSLTGNTNVVSENLTVQGPNSGGGTTNEGDYGIMVGGTTTGNSQITFTNTTIENTDGDGLAVYAHTATNISGGCGTTAGSGCGVNTDVVFTGGTLNNIGYHGITLEGVSGFNFYNNTVENLPGGHGGFIDLEVDAGAGCANTLCWDSNGKPIGNGEVGVAIVDNTFTNNLNDDIESTQSCVPASDWTFANNNYTNGSTFSINLNAPCVGTSLPGVTIGNIYVENNTSTALVNTGGAFGEPASSSLKGWQNVSFTGNSSGFTVGNSGAYFTVTDGGLSSNTTLTSTQAAFTSAHGTYQPAWATGSSFYPGIYINGTGLPTNDAVSSIDSANQVTMVTAATTTASNVTLQIGQSNYAANNLSFLGTIGLGLCGNSGTIKVQDNTFNDAYQGISDQGCTSGQSIPNTGTVTQCGNTWGLTQPIAYWSGPFSSAPYFTESTPAASPQTDTACA